MKDQTQARRGWLRDEQYLLVGLMGRVDLVREVATRADQIAAGVWLAGRVGGRVLLSMFAVGPWGASARVAHGKYEAAAAAPISALTHSHAHISRSTCGATHSLALQIVASAAFGLFEREHSHRRCLAPFGHWPLDSCATELAGQGRANNNRLSEFPNPRRQMDSN